MCAARVLSLALVVLLSAWRLGARGSGAGGCGVAELACRGGAVRCVRLDAWCDGTPHCADGSDEPPGCTVCNRTYYGRAGVAYSLGVRDAPRVPFLCHLTFTAGGGSHGDLVQLAFEEFQVGRYEAGALDGCPDGYMQLAELGRPFTGGSWCGAAGGAALYYSETATVTVSVKLFRARLGEPFAFKLRYKFLSQRDAVVRFGGAEAPLERGAVSPGTYCTRTYEECHRKKCRLQSPNYPGMYPRNVTCYWSLRQKDIPTCKHAMISVRQDYSHKMQIKRSISVASMNKTGRVVRAWRDCTGERDRLIVYDGGSTDDPVLVEYCGGDWLPAVTARGPDMLVAFHSSPYSAPPRPAPPAAPLRGFELDVDVIFADSDSYDYAREARRCEFHVKASSSEEEGNTTAPGAGGAGRGRRGVLRAPAHTLPPNTTCTWTFHGRPGDLVWIYFSSFTHYSLMDTKRADSSERDEDAIAGIRGGGGGGGGGAREDAGRTAVALPRPPPHAPPTLAGPRGPCAVELRVWDGGGAGAPLVGHYCDVAPALCARAALANATRVPRPCSPPDGYVSSAALMSLSATSLPGTATHPLSFSLHYEFVDARLDGTALQSAGASRARPAECARLLTLPGEFSSPRNALWFGRGGARRLRCVYRLQAERRVELRLAAASLGRTPRCVTRLDARTGRTACHPLPPDPSDTSSPPASSTSSQLEPDFDSEDDLPSHVPHLWIYDSPWPGYRVPLACICDNASAPLAVRGDGGALELELSGGRLRAREDHRHLHFRAAWAVVASEQDAPRRCANRRRLPQPGQHLHLTYPYEGDHLSECGETPFLLMARGNRSVFVRVWGEEIPHTPDPPLCHTTNRILVYDAHTSRLMKAICPGAEHENARSVHVFTEEWVGGGVSGQGGAALLVVWAAREAGAARLHWMEVWRAAAPPPPAAAEPRNVTAGCAHACGALGACMDALLWCDGAEDCPGGGDEAAGCGAGARLLRLLGGARALTAGGALAGALAALLLLAAAWRRRARRGKRVPGALAAGGRRLTEELLYDSRASTAS
ncbi:hypothetical protein O0L34_g16589 [Tuta absoluta]|nr:hypothetical protein O0L34_g16589 [Tuta absoluta]